MTRTCFFTAAIMIVASLFLVASHASAQGLEALARGDGGAVAAEEHPIAEAPVSIAAPVAKLPARSSQSVASSVYVLGIDDVVKVSVYGEEDLSGTYTVDSSGSISMPLIGAVVIAGQDLRQVEALLEGALSEGYLVDPDVSVEVSTYRPFFILGEVRSPGSYNYTNGATVLKAVALAGGFTYRANKKDVQVLKTKKNGSDLYENVPVDKAIAPGDIILVKEKFF